MLSLVPAIPLTVITITSVSTLVFTQHFLKRNLSRQTRRLTLENRDIQKSIYHKRIKNLVGIFGMLLLFYVISWSLFFVCVVYAAVVGWSCIPHQLIAAAFVLFLSNNISNPIIQVYFRSDLRDSLQTLFCCRWCRWHGNMNSSTRALSTTQRSEVRSRANSLSSTKRSSVAIERMTSKCELPVILEHVPCPRPVDTCPSLVMVDSVIRKEKQDLH